MVIVVTDKELKMEIRDYKRKTNMSSSDLKKWRGSDTYRQYVKVKQGPQPEEALNRNIRLQKKIEQDSVSKSDYKDLRKANSYLSRSKAEYYQEGAGGNKIPGADTTKRIAALRSWAFDPYDTYT